ncbi:MAG: peptide deformylase [Coriobacteriia bacterium]|nr:peptide deformylase [Coriobacteriia bacterium]
MEAMEILHHPSPVLKSRASEVDTSVDAGLLDLVRAMAETMYDENGIGLAAPQIGVDKRVIVFDVDERLAAVCNPIIVEASEETAVDDEGCLSVPGVTVPVTRSTRVVCKGLTIEGSDVSIEANDLLARVIQHEIDHLDGVLILDRAPAELRKELVRAYNEANGL